MNGMTLHDSHKWTPWWGQKASGIMKNKGYVIGFQNMDTGERFRLDYCPQEVDRATGTLKPIENSGLHINHDVPISADSKKECEHRHIYLYP